MGKSLQRALADVAKALKGDAVERDLATRTKLGAGTVHRLLYGQNVTLDSLQQFAQGFGLQAWQLLVPGFDPAAPPKLLTAQLEEELETLRAFVAEVQALGARNALTAAGGSRPDAGADRIPAVAGQDQDPGAPRDRRATAKNRR